MNVLVAFLCALVCLGIFPVKADFESEGGIIIQSTDDAKNFDAQKEDDAFGATTDDNNVGSTINEVEQKPMRRKK